MSMSDDWFGASFPVLIAGRDLSAAQIRPAIESLVDGRFEEWQAAAFLTALRMKGESGDEIAEAAEVLRQRMVPLPRGPEPVLDTCGTGGDGSGTFNISTAVALVAAGAGVPVVKHGNRSVSSRSGSADVLRELGVPIDSGVDWAARCLSEFGFAFCFAPHFHPAMANVAALRRNLGVRTLFNLLGPLCNPARAEYQLLGVGSPELLDPLTRAVSRSTRRAVLVHGSDGIDEVSLCAPTRVRIVEAGESREAIWTPADFGLEPCGREELLADGPKSSASMIEAILDGATRAPRRVVLANAAAALFAAGRVVEPAEGVELAKQAIDAGGAARVLAGLRRS